VDKKEFLIFGGVLVFAGGGLFFVYKKGLFANLFNTATTGDSSADGTIIQNAAPPPVAYTPTSTSYSPIPVGINTGASAANPVAVAGVNPNQVTLASVPSYQNSGGNTVAGTVPSDTSATHPATTTTVATPAPANSTPALTGNAAVINNWYQTLFGRQAEPGGIQFWENALNDPTSGVNLGNLESNLVRGAQNGDYAAVVVNDPAAAIQFRTNA
jgi:hypothetical protein